VRVDIETGYAYTHAEDVEGRLDDASYLEWARSKLLLWSSDKLPRRALLLYDCGFLHCGRV